MLTSSRPRPVQPPAVTGTSHLVSGPSRGRRLLGSSVPVTMETWEVATDVTHSVSQSRKHVLRGGKWSLSQTLFL